MALKSNAILYHSLLNLGLIIAKAEETKESLHNRIYFKNNF
jgi:hypothetical protein